MHSRLSPIHPKSPQKFKFAWKYARKRPLGVEINSSEVSFEIGRANSGQSVSDTVFQSTVDLSVSTLSHNRLWILMLLLMLGLIQIEYPFSKRTLPLRCFKGKNIIIVLIISYVWQFFQNGKISRNSHVLCAFQFHDQIKGS